MLTQTKYFGEIDYYSEDILHFNEGLFGFEEEKNFLLLPFAGSEGSLLCLQSLQTPQLAFVVMNPFSLKPDYAPVLQSEQLQLMNSSRSEDLCFYVLCVVRNPISDSTVNLKCPVAINDATNQAIQVILETQTYDFRHPLSEFETREAQATC